MLDFTRSSADVLNAPPTERPDNVRIATRRDEAKIFKLLTEGPTSLAKENALYSVAPAKVMAMIKNATEGKGGIIGIIEHEGRIAGSVGVFLSQYWYTEDWNVEELWNFVHPDFRPVKSGAKQQGIAAALVDFAKWANETLNVPLHMGIMSRIRMGGKIRLYQRKLMLIGAFFINPPTAGAGAAHLGPGMDLTVPDSTAAEA